MRNLPNVAPIMVREAKVDKPETVMLYLKGNIGSTTQLHSDYVLLGVPKYAARLVGSLADGDGGESTCYTLAQREGD